MPTEAELENGPTVTYRVKLIGRLRFLVSSLSSLGDNLPEGLHNNKCKECKSCLEYIKVKDK